MSEKPKFSFAHKLARKAEAWLDTQTERRLCYLLGILCAILLCWTILLQLQVASLSSQVQLQQTRIAQLEKSYKKQNNILYSDHMTITDIEKKWNDLNFRVLENTWKLNP